MVYLVCHQHELYLHASHWDPSACIACVCCVSLMTQMWPLYRGLCCSSYSTLISCCSMAPTIVMPRYWASCMLHDAHHICRLLYLTMPVFSSKLFAASLYDLTQSCTSVLHFSCI